MAIKTLHFVFRYGGVVQQVSDATCACEWVAIPRDCGRRTIEFWQVYSPRRRVVRGIVQASELVRSTGRDFDAVMISETGWGMNETHSYSSRVRVLIFFGFRGPKTDVCLAEQI